MSRHHYVRVGRVGQIGRFTSVDAVDYPRAARVILRTSRGLEIGEILSPAPETLERGLSDGAIIRGMTVEDQLLEARLDRKRDEAFAACETMLRERCSDAVLTDVEHLFDGGGLYFHFLGEPPAEVEALTVELAKTYDATAQIQKFSESLEFGCGPGCGTAAASGGGCTTCGAGCADRRRVRAEEEMKRWWPQRGS
ncbi:MAG: PSP1 C-terminal domain-containing protein [Pirellulales bacterium]